MTCDIPANLRILAQISSCESFDYDQPQHENMTYHSRSSSQPTTGECSPMSATFGENLRYGRVSSSNSSLSSSPTPGDSLDGSFLNNRKTQLEGLPEVDEDYVEREVQYDRSQSAQFAQSFHGLDRWSYEAPRMRPASFFINSPEASEREGSHSDNEGHWAKRRRSGDFAWNSFATGVVSRFPSLSRKSRDKKRTSQSLNATPYERSPSPSSSANFLRHSSSFRRSIGRRSTDRDIDEEDALQVRAKIETIMEDDFREPTLDQFFLPDEEVDLPLPQQDVARSTTPILPPLLENTQPTVLMQSPLQSPTVASDSGVFSVAHTPIGTPRLSGQASPVLSPKASEASMNRSRASTVVASSQIPPLVMADPNDEWAEKLGHANFKIQPEPYVPEVSNEGSCEALVKDWETARGEFAKHRSRTEMHFGRSSRTFHLTEEKWASIDAQWKENNEIASRRAVASGRFRNPSPKQPAPVANIPPIDDPRLIQSEEIPGPMTIEEPIKQITPPLSRKASKRASFKKIFGNFQLPSSMNWAASSSTEAA